MTMTTYLVTGAAGFIGSCFARLLAERNDARIVVLDKLSYAGNLMSLQPLIDAGRIDFVRGDIGDMELVRDLFRRYKPAYVVNFAAETHVDRSVDDPKPFIETNIDGVFNMLECARRQRSEQLAAGEAPSLRMFVQVSTDEVYGDLAVGQPQPLAPEVEKLLGRSGVTYGPDSFSEATPINPSSPYSAAKASADFLARSYWHSFGLPVLITRCSNNYGPRQFPEKLIPLAINNLLEGRAVPVYGKGLNVRDWIHVEDHCRGILTAIDKGRAGQVYNFGGYSERQNIDIVRRLVALVAEMAGTPSGDACIEYVSDRPGHDRRYAIDATKAMTELGWRPLHDFDQGLRQTVRWYLENKEWVGAVVSGEYRDYYNKMYSNR